MSRDFVVRDWQVLAFSPQTGGDRKRVDLVLLPLQPLISCPVVLLMVNGAERYGVVVANLDPGRLSFPLTNKGGRAFGCATSRQVRANEDGSR